MFDWIHIKTYLLKEEAEIVSGKLRSFGIEVNLTSDDCGGARAFLGNTLGTKLWVKKEDLQRAKEMLLKEDEDCL